MDYARIFLALIAVLGMIGAFAWLMRKGGFAQATRGAARRRRLEVVEGLFLDARRRAVILKCDGREHLVILGPAGETVVEHCLPGTLDEPASAAAPSANFVDAWRKFARRNQDVALSDAA
jgi:flagellar protein FliO/FliZ